MYNKGMSLRILCFCSLFQLTSATTQAQIVDAIGGSIELPGGTVLFSSEIAIGDTQSLTVTSESGAVIALSDGVAIRFFRVENGGTLILNGITLANVCARGLVTTS